MTSYKDEKVKIGLEDYDLLMFLEGLDDQSVDQWIRAVETVKRNHGKE